MFCSEEPPPGCGSPHVDGLHHEHCRLPHEHTVSTRQMDRLVWNIHRHSIQWATAWNVILRSYWHFDYGPCYVENYPQLTSLYPACDWVTPSLSSVQVSATSCPCASSWASAEATLMRKTLPTSTSSLQGLACVWQAGSWPLCWQQWPFSLGDGRQLGGLEENIASFSANSQVVPHCIDTYYKCHLYSLMHYTVYIVQ